MKNPVALAFWLAFVFVLSVGCNDDPTPDTSVEQDQEQLEAIDVEADEVGEELTGCRTDADCGTESTGGYCQPATGLCVACLNDAHCAGDETCNGSVHRCELLPTTCRDDSDCETHASGPACELDSGDCVPCTTDVHCNADHMCNTLSHQCEQKAILCETQEDCVGAAGGPVCEQNSGMCVQCLLDSDCSGNELCVDTVCVKPPCSSNTDCAGVTPICQLSTGECVECLLTEDCPDAFECQAVFCVDPKACSRSNFVPMHEWATRRSTHTYYLGFASKNDPCDVLAIEFYPGEGIPGVYPLGSKPIDFTFATCETCLLLRPDADMYNSDQVFFATSGVIGVSEWGEVGGTFAATIENAYLIEVTIEKGSYATRRVPGGETWCLDHVTVNATIE